jgi:hypothetical protein
LYELELDDYGEVFGVWLGIIEKLDFENYI